MNGDARSARDGFWVEAGLLVATLVGGAALRYWLSTAVPFDAGEVAILEDATDPERPMRVPFIMLNGMSLFVLYIVVRRSAGIGAAFAVQLALQASLAFQLEAMRVRWASAAVLLGLFALAYFRMTRPPLRLPPRIERVLFAVALLLALRELQLLVTLPGRLAEIRANTTADVGTLSTSLAACGSPAELPLARFRHCSIAWPPTRSVEQQEVLWEHQRRLGKDARAVDAAGDLPPDAPAEQVVLLDRPGAGFIVVPEGPLAVTARRILTTDAH